MNTFFILFSLLHIFVLGLSVLGGIVVDIKLFFTGIIPIFQLLIFLFCALSKQQRLFLSISKRNLIINSILLFVIGIITAHSAMGMYKYTFLAQTCEFATTLTLAVGILYIIRMIFCILYVALSGVHFVFAFSNVFRKDNSSLED